ncbi:MAG: TolC family protein [Deltaproteobacteria bacterium]|nr:TolC family protein [Deltaproteobacteria bacterium]
MARATAGLIALAWSLGGRAAHAEPPAPAQAVRTPTAAFSLPELVALALEANQQVKIDVARIDEARALVSLATAEAYPKLKFQALFGGPTPEAQTTKINDPSELTPASFEGDFDFGELGVIFRANASLVQPVFTFGKLRAAKDAASNLVRAAEHKTDITKAEVVVNVYRAFWGYQLVRGFVASLAEGEKILVDVLAKVDELLDNDSPQVTENDRLRLIHGLATLRVRLADARMAEELALKAARLLTHRPPESPLVLVERDIDDEIPESIPALSSSLESLSTHRPEVLALDALVKAHEEWARFQARRMLPTFFLGGFAEYVGTTNATNQNNPFVYDRFNYFDTGIGLGVIVELDVYTKLAELEGAEAQLGTRLAEQAAAKEGMDLESRKLHTELTSAYERLQHLRRAHRAAKSWLTAEVLAYDVGTGSARELIDAFLARAAAEGELSSTYYEVHVGLANFARASGTLLDRDRPQ